MTVCSVACQKCGTARQSTGKARTTQQSTAHTHERSAGILRLSCPAFYSPLKGHPSVRYRTTRRRYGPTWFGCMMVRLAMPGHSVKCHIILHGFGASMHTYGSGSNPIPMNFDKRVLQSCPKVLLHEHLDGVLRPQTVIQLARDAGYAGLPTEDPQALAQWFYRGANQGSLAKYLEGFTHTIAVMQSEEALERVAYEQAEDLHNDGVVYFETRFAPIFHTQKGLTHQQVVAAVLKGLGRARKDFGVASGVLLCGMRNMDRSLEMAE